MSKDPAVLLYTSDFLSGTFTMSNEQVGMYIRLLCIQHQKGKLSEKDMISICPSRDEEVWGKFEIIDGFYINKKMYEEAERRKNFCESRKNNRSTKNKSKTYENHMSQHMETETETITKTLTLLEGGMGGGFIWEDEKRKFLEDGPWQMKFCTSRKLYKAELDEWMNKFLEDIELRNETKPKKELQSHFTNWFNKQKITKKPKNGTYQLLEELRLEHEAATRNQAGGNGNQYESGTTHW